MVGNLSSVYIKNQDKSSFSRVVLGNEDIGIRPKASTRVTNDTNQRSSSQQQNTKRTVQSESSDGIVKLDKNEAKQRFENILNHLKNRTVLLEMIENMGATGTNATSSGQFFDTYV